MMRSSLRAAFTGLAFVAAMLATTAAGTAATAATYHGYFAGEATYAGCDVPPKTLAGNWNVQISGDKAVPSVNLFYDGDHHLAYGGKALDEFTVLKAPGNAVFSIRGDVVGTDVTVTMTLYKNGELTYVVAPYPPELFGYDCASLTLTGHQT